MELIIEILFKKVVWKQNWNLLDDAYLGPSGVSPPSVDIVNKLNNLNPDHLEGTLAQSIIPILREIQLCVLEISQFHNVRILTIISAPK